MCTASSKIKKYSMCAAASTPRTEKKNSEKKAFNNFFVMHRNRSIVPPNRRRKVPVCMCVCVCVWFLLQMCMCDVLNAHDYKPLISQHKKLAVWPTAMMTESLTRLKDTQRKVNSFQNSC